MLSLLQNQVAIFADKIRKIGLLEFVQLHFFNDVVFLLNQVRGHQVRRLLKLLQVLYFLDVLLNLSLDVLLKLLLVIVV